MSRPPMSALALAIAYSHAWTAPTIASRESGDPHKPRPRSKGEKARNKRNRP